MNKTFYRLEAYYKTQNYREGMKQYKVLDLLEADLENLDEENFQEKIDLGFDIRNASQLRYFISTVFFMKARAEGLILVNFDTEDSMVCQNWTIEIDFDLNLKEDIKVNQEAEYNEIQCLKEWRKQFFGDLTPPEENPIREKVLNIYLGSLLHQLCFSFNKFGHILFFGYSDSKYIKVQKIGKTKGYQETLDGAEKKCKNIPTDKRLGEARGATSHCFRRADR